MAPARPSMLRLLSVVCLLCDVAAKLHDCTQMRSNVDEPVLVTINRFVFRLRRSNDGDFVLRRRLGHKSVKLDGAERSADACALSPTPHHRERSL